MNRPPRFKFRLYIAGDTENSVHALANLAALCDVYLPNGHDIEIVDVSREQGRALKDGIFMTPTLVKLAPSPMQRIVGTLSHTASVSQMLGVGPSPA